MIIFTNSLPNPWLFCGLIGSWSVLRVDDVAAPGSVSGKVKLRGETWLVGCCAELSECFSSAGHQLSWQGVGFTLRLKRSRWQWDSKTTESGAVNKCVRESVLGELPDSCRCSQVETVHLRRDYRFWQQHDVTLVHIELHCTCQGLEVNSAYVLFMCKIHFCDGMSKFGSYWYLRQCTVK